MYTSRLVSIVMPAKNVDKYLEACLQSILDQTYANWELLITNDHSIDHTREILERFKKVDDRIQVFQNKGHGIIPALNTAYQYAQGEYITRMDADDIMSKDKLALLVEACSEDDILSTGLVEYFSEGGVGEGYQKYAHWLNTNLLSVDPFSSIYKECVIPSPCWMLRRITFENLGGFDSTRYPEDYDLCFRMRGAKLKVKTVDKVLHHWRDYPERSSRTDENYADNRFLEIKLDYFLQDDFDAARPLEIWGAGQKGKSVAQGLIDREVSFDWITNNEKKIGHNIYGVVLQSEQGFTSWSDAQIIVCIAGPEDQEYIRRKLIQKSGSRAYWFC